MKVKYYNNINAKDYVEINVNSKVAHFLEKNEKEQKEIYQQDFEVKVFSLDEMMKNGFQPSDDNSIEDEIIRRQRETKYFNSYSYKKFRSNLRREIRKVFDIMSEQVRKAMYLRFFENKSISEIARELGCSKATAQSYLARGTFHIRYFLNKDIKQQEKLERERKMKREQAKLRRFYSSNKYGNERS